MKNARILIADPDRAERSRNAVLLSRAGHKADTAGTVTETLERIETSGYDLLIVDLGFCGNASLALLQQLKKSWPSLPVIVVGESANLEPVVTAFRRGALDFVEKPLDSGSLEAMARRALAVRELGARRRRVLALLERGEHPFQPQEDAPIAQTVGTLRAVERSHIMETLRRTRGNKKQAAQLLGIHRGTLYAKLRRHGLMIPATPDEATVDDAVTKDVTETPSVSVPALIKKA